MLFLKDLNIFHIDGKEIPCITASNAPDTQLPGAPGSLYMDTDTGRLYVCTAADILRNAFSWKIVGDVDSGTVQQAVSDYLAFHPATGPGISDAAIALLISILQNAVFSSNQTGNITALAEALASGGSGGGSSTETPNEPDEPVADNITMTDGVMTIISVGSAITVSDGVMTIG